MKENKELEFLLNESLNKHETSNPLMYWWDRITLSNCDFEHLCPDCNKKMTKVREGKYQCDTINCINS